MATLPEGSLLKTNNKNPSSHSSHLQDSISSRLMISNESNENPVLNEVLIKLYTGDDNVAFRKIWATYNTIFVPCCKILLISNHKPYLNSYDKAMIDRMKLLPFNHRFADTPENNKKVKDLQADINYFFSYLVRKAKDYYANPFLVKNIPKVVKEATSEIIQENDYLGDFIKENFVMEYDYLKANKSRTIWSNIMKKNLKYIQDNYDSSLKNYGLYVKVMYSFYTKKFERPLKKSEFLKKLFTKDFSQTYTNFNSLLYKEYRIAFKCVLDESEKLELEFDVDEEEIQELQGNTDDEGRQHFLFFASYQQQRERERERERERKEREKERQGKQPKEVDSDTDLD